MGQNPKVVSDALRRGVKATLVAGMRGVYLDARKKVRENLTGRIMNQQTGRTLRNVMRRSRMTRDGFALATTSPSLKAWMKGSKRRGYWVRPRQAKALSWVGRDGVRRFSRGHYINPWQFRPVRPVFIDAIERVGQAGVLRAFRAGIGPGLRQTFRGGKLTVRIVAPGKR